MLFRSPTVAISTVLSTDEAVVASTQGTDNEPSVSTITAPIRLGGHPVGIIHAEYASDDESEKKSEQQAMADDLDFVMAVSDSVSVALENLSTRETLSSKLASTADENERLRHRLRIESKIVGNSEALQGILGQVVRVASTKATVLKIGRAHV